MASLKEIFDKEQAKIRNHAESLKKREEDFFNQKVVPVVQRILDTINAEPGLLAGYRVAGQDGTPFIKEARYTSTFYWGIEIEIRQKAFGPVMGAALIKLDGHSPSTITVRGHESSTEYTYALSREAIVAEESLGRRESKLEKMTPEERDSYIEQRLEAGLKDLSEKIVLLAARNGMRPTIQQAEKSLRVLGM